MDLSRSPDLFAEEPLLLQENESQEGGLSYHRDSDSISFLFMFHVVILSLNFATNAMSAWTSRGSNLKTYKFGFLFRFYFFFCILSQFACVHDHVTHSTIARYINVLTIH